MQIQSKLSAIIGAILLSLFFQYAKAQNNHGLDVNMRLTPTYFSVTPLIYSPVKITNFGADWLESYSSPGLSLKLGRELKLADRISMNLEFGMASISNITRFHFVSKINNADIHIDRIRNFDWEHMAYFQTSLGVVYSLKTEKSLDKKFRLSLGLTRMATINYGFSKGVSYFAGSENVNVFRKQIQAPEEDGTKIWFTNWGGYFKYGFVRGLGNFHWYTMNLVVCYYFKDFGHGFYNFKNLEEYSYGTLRWKANYVGIELSRSINL